MDVINSLLRAARAGNLKRVIDFIEDDLVDINSSNQNGLTALHSASKEGHSRVVEELISRGANVHAKTHKGNTALHIASLAGHEPVVRLLIENGADVDAQSASGFTALYMAAQENHESIVKLLLANKANQNIATTDGFTPLAVAMQQGHEQIASILLNNEARGRIRFPGTTESGRSLLHIAAKKDDCTAAALLMQNNISPDITSKSGFTALHVACHYGNKAIAKLLLERGADVNFQAKHNITPLHVAAKWGRGELLELLVGAGARIDAITKDGLTPLHCAARSGHDQVVEELIKLGAPLAAKTRSGLAPLHMATQGDHHGSAQLLLDYGTPVDAVTVDYLTALHVASHCGHVKVAKLLLNNKADPNFRALNGFTSLHIACKKNRLKVVELLLKYGASLNAVTESGLTPLHVAAFMGCVKIVVYLLEMKANLEPVTVRGETPLHLATRANQLEVVQVLLQYGAQVGARAKESQTALHIAARLGNAEVAKLLLRHGIDVDAPTKDSYTALHIAAKEGHEEVVTVLLNHGANIACATRNHGFTPLHLASKYGIEPVVELLLHYGAPVDAQGKNGVTPLHVATHYDHPRVVELLLERGRASPHAQAKNGYTALHIAAKGDRINIARSLLQHQANPNAESKAGFCPLHLAAQEGRTEMAELLLLSGAQVNCRAKNGITPLHLCAQEDHLDVAVLLVKRGADQDAQTKGGFTPLHVASHFNRQRMIMFLLVNGANVNIPAASGYTPLHQASQQGNQAIVDLLLNYNAKPDALTESGQTALSIAQNLGYVSIVDTLKVVTETVVKTTTMTITEEKFKLVAPETMQETFVSDSEDEADDTAHAESVKFLTTADVMRNLNSSAMAEDNYNTSQSNLMPASARQSQQHLQQTDEMAQDLNYLSREAPLDGGESTFGAAASYSQLSAGGHLLAGDYNDDEENQLPPLLLAAPDEEAVRGRQLESPAFVEQLAEDNVELQRPLQQAGFLVSFMVDARGGAMRGCRHSGVRLIIPPGSAPSPMRITCRYLRRERLLHPPPLMEGEACASKIMEVGPAGARFLGPVLLEVPHFASLRDGEREIVVLRSDTGEVWREHLSEADDRLIQSMVFFADDADHNGQQQHDADGRGEQPRRLVRIVATEFPQYFAVISRVRQEVFAVGPAGATVNSQSRPQVQAIFPQGSLKKRIKIGLQVQRVPEALVIRHLGSLRAASFSPIVSIEPRRRKFHRSIELRMPLPATFRSDLDANLRLLCSIEEGQQRAEWKDMTDSIRPFHLLPDNSLAFPTSISARYWLVHCERADLAQSGQLLQLAHDLYRRLICPPYMAKFVVFSKRRALNEASLRLFCLTDDKEERTLEEQEHFKLVARSRDVEVCEGQRVYLELGGNLLALSQGNKRGHQWPSNSAQLASQEQPSFLFRAFQENRLALQVGLRELQRPAEGRIAFMEDSIRFLASLSRQQRDFLYRHCRRAICALALQLPPLCLDQAAVLGTPRRNSRHALARIGSLSLGEIAAALETGGDQAAIATTQRARSPALSGLSGDSLQTELERPDWLRLAPRLGIPRDEVELIAAHCQEEPANSPELILLAHWHQLAAPDSRDQDLARALLAIGRHDIVERLGFPVEPKKMSRSTMELLREIDLIPVQSHESLYANSQELLAHKRGNSLGRLADLGGNRNNNGLGEARGGQLHSSSRSALGERTNYDNRLDNDHNDDDDEHQVDSVQRMSTKEWYENKNGTMSHGMEQTTLVESRPRAASSGANSKKQRKRRA